MLRLSALGQPNTSGAPKDPPRGFSAEFWLQNDLQKTSENDPTETLKTVLPPAREPS